MNKQDFIPGAVVQVTLNPSKGSEQAGFRPCVIVSPPAMNKALTMAVVVPLTSSCKDWPTRVNVHFSNRDGQAAIEQIRSVSQKRLKKLLGMLSQAELDEIRLVIRQAYTEG